MFTRLSRLLIPLLIFLLPVALFAAQSSLNEYDARLPGLKRQIPAVVASASQAAETMLAHPEARLQAPYNEQMGFCDEMMDRSGGLTRFHPYGQWDYGSTPDDAALLSVRSWEGQADFIRKRVREYRKNGWTVTVIASKAGMPADLGADFLLDNGAPDGSAQYAPVNAIANITLGWMWCCEYAAAMSRKGKFPAILLCALMPGADEYDASIQSPDGRLKVVDCPKAVAAGSLSNIYLQRVRLLMHDLHSRKVRNQLNKAANIIADRLAKGGRVGFSSIVHFGQDEMRAQNKTPWLGFRSAWVSETSIKQHLQPGDLLIWLTYAGVNSPYEDYAKNIAAAGVDLITCYTPDPTWAKNPPATLTHIDQSWKLPDAEVPIPVFPNRMAPVSGINVGLLTRMLDDSVSARLAKIGAHPPAPTPPPVRPDAIERVATYNYFDDRGLGTAGKWGIIDMAGNEIVPLQYTECGDLKEGLAPVKIDGKWGCVDETGELVIPATFDRIDGFEKGVSMVAIGNKIKFIDKTGNFTVPAQFDQVEWPQMSIYPPFLFARIGKNWGVIDHAGKELLPCKYDGLSGFDETAIVFTRDGKNGLIKLTGDEILPAKYDSIGYLGEKRALVQLAGKWGISDSDGKEIVPAQYEGIGAITDDLMIVKIGNKWGVATEAGTLAVKPKYDEIRGFTQGVAMARAGKLWAMIDTAGNELVQPQFDDVRGASPEGLIPVRKDGKWGCIDTKGAQVIPCQYYNRLYFTNGVAVVIWDNAYRLIDAKGADVAAGYDFITDARQGLFKVARDGKWGLIDKTGKEVVPPKYSYIINYYWGDRTVFAAGGRWTEEYGKPILVDAKWGLLDDKGQELIPAKFDRIYPWGEKYYQAAKDMEAVYPRP